MIGISVAIDAYQVNEAIRERRRRGKKEGRRKRV